MFRRALAFVTRRDGAVGRRAARRLRSPRASVYLEYAIVLPLAILIVSTLIEFCAYWDAKIMANHTAWTCARIATVHAGEGEYQDNPAKNRLRTLGMKTATTLLMSTCSMGSMHGNSTQFASHWFQEMVLAPLRSVQETFKKNLTADLTRAYKKSLAKIIGEDAATKFLKQVVETLMDEFVTPVVREAVRAVASIFDPIFQTVGGVMDGNRQLRQLAYAAGRVASHPDLVTVTEHDTFPLVFAKVGSLLTEANTQLDFPRCLDSQCEVGDWFVKKDGGWPPNNQRQRMIEVKIAWPFERAWMFPVLSQAKLPEEKAQSLEGVPTAVGRALFYPQPLILNKHLYSVGASPFAPGKVPKIPDYLKDIRNSLLGFLKVAALSYHYQLKDEVIGPFDSNKGASWSYKGIGLPVTGGPDEGKIYQCDGLVAWMDRAPKDFHNQGEWKKKPPPEDYFKCFCEAGRPSESSHKGDSLERVKFWHGIPFLKITLTTKCLDNLCDRKYGGKEWFFWGNGTDRHLRQYHKDPREHRKLLQTENRRQAFLVGGDELGREVTQAEYEAQVRAAGGAAAPYALYRILRDRAPDVFGSRVRTMLATWRPDALAECDAAERRVAEGFANNRYTDMYDKTLELIRASSKELDDATGGGGGGGGDPGDPGKFFDFGDIEKQIMENPKQAAEILKRKLEELKAKVHPKLREVDRCEQRLRDLDKQLANRMDELAAARAADLARFAAETGRALLENRLAIDAKAVCARLRSDHAWGGEGPLAVTRQFNGLADEYYTALVNLYNAERELALALGCKSGKVFPPTRPDQPAPFPKPQDPDRPKPSSPGSGSDEDNGGDSWKLQDHSWSKDQGGEDV